MEPRPGADCFRAAPSWLRRVPGAPGGTRPGRGLTVSELIGIHEFGGCGPVHRCSNRTFAECPADVRRYTQSDRY